MSRLASASLTLLLLSGSALGQSYPFGHGAAGSGGIVPLHTGNSPWIGHLSFRLQVDKTLGGATAFFLVSAAQTDLAFAGGSVYVSLTPPNPLIFLPVAASGSAGTPGAGSASLLLPIPPAPILVGFSFYSQVIVDETTGGGSALVPSNGVAHDIGEPPRLFVGTSILNNDPYHVIDPPSFSIVETGANVNTDNASGAVSAHGGRDLFVSSSIQQQVSHALANQNPMPWQVAWAAPGTCYGLTFDRARNLVWTLSDLGSGRELVALDADPAGGFGPPVKNTSGMAGGLTFVERWGMSPSGRLAAVTSFLPSNLILVDLDPNSATHLQNLAALPVPSVDPFSLITEVRITPDEEYVLLLILNPGATASDLARFHIPTLSFVDHDTVAPGIQHIGASSNPPVAFGSGGSILELASNGAFAIVGGVNGCGWVGRLGFDLANPGAYGFTPWSPAGILPNARGGVIAGDSLVAVSSWNSSGCGGTPLVEFFNAASGASLGIVPIPLNSNSAVNQNLYTLAYR